MGSACNFPRFHTVAHTIADSVAKPTKNVWGRGIDPAPAYPTKRGQPSAINCSPDIATISPVTSGGNKTRNRLVIRYNTPVINPADATIPNSSENPPVRSARIDDGRYVRLLESGQK